MAKAPPVVDVHTHIMFDELLGLAGELGPGLRPTDDGAVLWMGGYELPLHGKTSLDTEPSARVETLDEVGIDIQVIAPSPLWYFNHVDLDIGSSFCRRHNELLADWSQQRPERFRFFAALPTQDIGAAIKEMERAVRELGALAPYISTDLGIDLDDHALDDFYAAVVDLGVPLMIHPGVAGIDSPVRDPRLRRFIGDVLLGYPYEETLAIIHLIYGRVLERHPRLDVCLTHGGGAAPYLYGRLRQYATGGMRWNPDEDVSEDLFGDYFRRLWFDTHVHHPDALRLLTSLANRDRLVLGTNMAGWDADSAPDAGDPTLDLAGNAARLLRL